MTFPLQDVSINYTDKSRDYNENIHTPIDRPSLLESLRQKHECFKVQNIESKITRHNNPQYWLQQDKLHNSPKLFFKTSITHNEDPIPQIEVLSRLQQNQSAYTNFP